MDSWTSPTVLATFGLAAMTAMLAWQTKRLATKTGQVAEDTRDAANATRDAAQATAREAAVSAQEVEVARKALESSIRPIVVDVPREETFAGIVRTVGTVTFENGPTVDLHSQSEVVIKEDDLYLYISIPLRNVGPGVAMITGLGLVFDGGKSGWSGAVSLTVVPPGEVTRFRFSVPKSRLELQSGIERLKQGHGDLEARYSDVNGEQTTITRANLFDGRVRQVFFQRPGEEKEFAGSGPSD